MNHRQLLIPLMLMLTTILGCDEDEIARRAAEIAAHQAEQNVEMSKLHAHVAEGTKRLVEADAKARDDLLKAEASLDEQRKEIDAERKQLAHERYRDPLIANTLFSAAILIACVLPVVLGIYVLKNVSQEQADTGLAELLITEMTTEKPLLLPGPMNPRAAIEGGKHASLPAA